MFRTFYVCREHFIVDPEFLWCPMNYYRDDELNYGCLKLEEKETPTCMFVSYPIQTNRHEPGCAGKRAARRTAPRWGTCGGDAAIPCCCGWRGPRRASASYPAWRRACPRRWGSRAGGSGRGWARGSRARGTGWPGPEMYIWKVFVFENYFQIIFFWCICICIWLIFWKSIYISIFICMKWKNSDFKYKYILFQKCVWTKPIQNPYKNPNPYKFGYIQIPKPVKKI